MARKNVSRRGRWIQFGAAMFGAVAAVLQLHGAKHILLGLALCGVGAAFGLAMLIRRDRRERQGMASEQKTEDAPSASNAG